MSGGFWRWTDGLGGLESALADGKWELLADAGMMFTDLVHGWRGLQQIPPLHSVQGRNDKAEVRIRFVGAVA